MKNHPPQQFHSGRKTAGWVSAKRARFRWLTGGLFAAGLMMLGACTQSPARQLAEILKEELGGNFSDVEDLVLWADFAEMTAIGELKGWVQGEHNYDWKTGTPSDCESPVQQTGCETTTFVFETFDNSDDPEVELADPNEYTVYKNNLFSRGMKISDGALVADYSDQHNSEPDAGHGLVLPSYGMRYEDPLPVFTPTSGDTNQDLVVRFEARAVTNAVRETAEKIIITLTADQVADKEGDTASLESTAANEVTGQGVALVLESTRLGENWGSDPAAPAEDQVNHNLQNKIVFRVERLTGQLYPDPLYVIEDKPKENCGTPGASEYIGQSIYITGFTTVHQYFGGIFTDQPAEDPMNVQAGECPGISEPTRYVVGNPPEFRVVDLAGRFNMYSLAATDKTLFNNFDIGEGLSPVDLVPANGRFFSPNYNDDINILPENNGYDYAIVSDSPSEFRDFHEYEVVLQADGLVRLSVDGEPVAYDEVENNPAVENGELRGFVDNGVNLFPAGLNLKYVSVKYHSNIDEVEDFLALRNLKITLR